MERHCCLRVQEGGLDAEHARQDEEASPFASNLATFACRVCRGAGQ